MQTTTTITSQEYTIPAANYATLEEKLATLNKRAKRLGCAAITLRLLSEETRTDDQEMASVYYHVEVTGERPLLNGWLVVGIIEYLRQVEMAASPGTYEDVVLVYPVPGVTQPEELDAYENNDAFCAHCRSHRNRKKTYILRNEEQGTRLQVGGDCLKDFTGHNDPHAVAAMAEILFEAGQACEDATDDDLWEMGGGKKQAVLDLSFYLAWVAMIARKEGFVSATQAEIKSNVYTSVIATWERALIAIDYAHKYPESKEIERPTEHDKALVQEALTWIRSEEAAAWITTLIRKDYDRLDVEQGGFGSYMQRLSRLCKMRSIPEKDYKMVAGVIARYQKHQEEAMKGQRVSLVSHYQGTVDKRQVWTLTVEAIKSSDYSWTVKMSDAEGNVFTWFANALDTLQQGHTYQLKGTVKKHEPYKGVETTYLIRCKVVKDLTPPEPDPVLPDLGTCACGEPIAELIQSYGSEWDMNALHVSHCLLCHELTRHTGKDFHLCVACGFGDKEDEQGNFYVHHNGEWELDPAMTPIKQRLERGY